MATTDRKIRATRAGTGEDRDELVLWRRITADLQVLDNTCTKTNSLLKQLNQLYATEEHERRAVQKGERLCEEAIETTLEEKTMATRLKERLAVLIALKEATDNEGIPSSPGSTVTAASTPESSRRRKRHLEQDAFDGNTRKPRSSPTKNMIPIPAGQRVAAKVSSGDDDVDEWILAVVKRYYTEKQVYEVEDAEEDDSGNIATYCPDTSLPLAVVVVVVGNAGQRTNEFPIGHVVLALYPNTTCFYKASVTLPPSTRSSMQGQYVVQFEDDNEQAQAVPANMVLDYPGQID
ncbi:SGF29 tudor-like domain-containing protein [Syncephalis plumigaleata]|nr:SGF29 tudor-like domain-containing protein [Syncephalis plumigaleata]